MKKPGSQSIPVGKRLAYRMIFLLVAALLGGLLFVFHVRDMENRRLRRDLQGLAESLAIMLGPEQVHQLQSQPADAAHPENARIRDQLRTVKSIHHGHCRLSILERQGVQVHCLLSSDDDAQALMPAVATNTIIPTTSCRCSRSTAAWYKAPRPAGMAAPTMSLSRRFAARAKPQPWFASRWLSPRDWTVLQARNAWPLASWV